MKIGIQLTVSNNAVPRGVVCSTFQTCEDFFKEHTAWPHSGHLPETLLVRPPRHNSVGTTIARPEQIELPKWVPSEKRAAMPSIDEHQDLLRVLTVSVSEAAQNTQRA